VPKQIAMIHTVTALVPVFAELLQKELPAWESFNIVDESLLRNTIRTGELSVTTMRRLAGYVWSAADAGADAVMVTCSSLGPAVEAAMPLAPVKLFRVDEAMADAAVVDAQRIGVLATLQTTLVPTCALIERRAQQRGRTVTLVRSLCPGAFDRLQRGDRDGHDEAIKSAFAAMASTVEVVVLAQASMARVVDSLAGGQGQPPVLSSPRLAVERLRQTLQ
jgi:Asp/Glu/hydantoin racemase